jgi:hypothetical protein
MSAQRPDQPTLEEIIALGQCVDGDARITELRGLPIRERLQHIAWDDTRSLSCYPADLAVCTAEDVKQLDPVARERLIAKLRERKKGPWHNLARGLGLA